MVGWWCHLVSLGTFGSCSGKPRAKQWLFPQSCLWNQKLGQAVLYLGLHSLKSKAMVFNLSFFQSLTHLTDKPSRMFMTFFSKECFPSIFMQWATLLDILSIHHWPNNTRHTSHQFSRYPFSASKISVGMKRALHWLTNQPRGLFHFRTLWWDVETYDLLSVLQGIFKGALFLYFLYLICILTLPQSKGLGEWKLHLFRRETKLFRWWPIMSGF